MHYGVLRKASRPPFVSFLNQVVRAKEHRRRIQAHVVDSQGISGTTTKIEVEYKWIDGVERLEYYEAGGYHPIVIGEVLHQRYTIVDKLGFGGHSTVWMAHDSQSERLVALKVGISYPSPAQRESEILQALSKTSSNRISATATSGGEQLTELPIPRLLDVFHCHGPNGAHPCYAMDLMQGDLSTASFSRLFPIKVARALAARLVHAVAFMHIRGFAHGDIRLRNILVKAGPSLNTLSTAQFKDQFGDPEVEPITTMDGAPLPAGVPSHAVLPINLGKHARDFTLDDARRAILCDFGETFAPQSEQRLGKECNTPVGKRAPEATYLPEQSLSFPSDIWSLAIAIWDLLGMKSIFSESEPKCEVLAQHIDVLGSQSFPSAWDKVPHESGETRDPWPPLEVAFEDFVQTYRRKRLNMGIFDEEETKDILRLMRAMLRFHPAERLTIQEVLTSDWITKWALPELLRQ